MPPNDISPNDNERSLRMIRIVWFAILAGPIFFIAMMVFGMWNASHPPADPAVLRILFLAAAIMLVVLVPAGFFIRQMIYNKSRLPDNRVAAGAYFTGNVILFAMCEGVAFFGCVGSLLNNGPWPHLAVSIVALCALAASYPTGAAMMP